MCEKSMIKCIVCAGSGTVNDGDTCHKCFGSGGILVFDVVDSAIEYVKNSTKILRRTGRTESMVCGVVRSAVLAPENRFLVIAVNEHQKLELMHRVSALMRKSGFDVVRGGADSVRIAGRGGSIYFMEYEKYLAINCVGKFNCIFVDHSVGEKLLVDALKRVNYKINCLKKGR